MVGRDYGPPSFFFLQSPHPREGLFLWGTDDDLFILDRRGTFVPRDDVAYSPSLRAQRGNPG
jgi:hypothetical protein